MALATTLAGVFFITTFFLIIVILIIFKLAGKSFRQYIKSKFGPYKKIGSWFLIFDKNKKVSIEYKFFPKNSKLKIKSGEIPEEDQYANIEEVYHQLDKSGNPVILAMEDLPFTFFLKKHHLNDFFPAIDKMVELIDNTILSNSNNLAHELETKIKKRLQSAKDNLKYIPDAWKKYNTLMNLDKILASEKSKTNKETTDIQKLKMYKNILLDLKSSIVSANHQVVNVYDLFETVGFVKNITKMAFSEYQNGWLAAKQTHDEKKLNTTLLIIMIIIGVIGLVTVYFSYSQGEQIKTLQTQLSISTTQVNNLYKFINPDINFDTNQIIQPSTTVNGVVQPSQQPLK